MKKNIIFLLASALFLLSCANKDITVSVSNNSETDRIGEMVELCLCSFPKITPEKIVILDESGKQVPYQLLKDGEETYQSILFPVTVMAGGSKSFIVKEGVPDTFRVRTFGRFVPERKDDFAWESDKIAFRMYGPALASENPSNGVDIWCKKTSGMVIDKWYKDDLAGVATYHQDHGEGLDCYKVAHTLGCGGITPVAGNKLFVGSNFTSYKVLDNGPLRTSFILYYNNVPYKNKTINEEIKISIDAGSHLNKAVVKYTGDFKTMEIAAGIYLHDKVQNLKADTLNSYIGYCEDQMTQVKPFISAGRVYTGVVFPEKVNMAQIDDNAIGVSSYKNGDEFVYYFGAGWSESDITSDVYWFDYLKSFKYKTNYPLDIKIIE